MTRTASLADIAGSIDAGPLAGFRNAIINGNFDVWQRGTSFSNPASGAYTADRWIMGWDGSGATRTISAQTFIPGQTDVPGNPGSYFRWNQSVAGTAGGENTIGQRIEFVYTYADQQVTLSFYAKAASSLTMPAIYLLQYFGTGGSPSDTVYTTVVSNQVVGTSWTKYTYTLTVPSISGKTLGTNGDNFLMVEMRLPINTTFTFDLAQVQLELGPVATPFERRPYGIELALCQRYYQTINVNEQAASAGDSLSTWSGVVAMRATPTVIQLSAGSAGSASITSFTPYSAQPAGYFQINASGAGGYVINASYALSAEL